MRNKLFLMLVLIFGLQVHSQNIKEILTHIQQEVSTNDFKVNLKYQLFKGVDGEKSLESFDGIYLKSGVNFYNKIKNTETIVGNDFMVKINHDQKAMLYDNFEIDKSKPTDMLNLTILLKNFESPSVQDLGETWKCEMTAVEYSQMPYSKVVLFVDKKTYRIKKQILFLTSIMNFSDDATDFNIPRLEIEYSNYTSVNATDKLLFKREKYISIKNNKIIPSSRFKEYEIINLKKI